MTQDSPQVQEIRARYKASLSDKARMINEYLTAFQENSNDELLTQIRGELHKLAGSAGMYDYDDISSLARSGMVLIDEQSYDGLANQLQLLKDLLLQHA